MVSYHNVWYITRLMEEARKAIEEGRFKSFKKEVIKIYKD